MSFLAFLIIYLFCALGIVISVILPILKQSLPRPKDTAERGESESWFARVWPKIKPYLILGIFSLITAILIVAFAGDLLKDWKAALLAGYAWDSTIQKIGKG